MKRQVRQYVVEVKNKRSNRKRASSIWGDLDLAAIAAQAEVMDLPKPQLLDSVPAPVVLDHGHKLQAELDMITPDEADAVQAAIEQPEAAEKPVAKKAGRPKTAKAPKEPKAPKTSRMRAAKAEPAPVVQAAPVRQGRKVYSLKERAEKLSKIGKAIDGGESVKSATTAVGVSEQTYYQWKKAAAAAPVAAKGDELKDLVALEEENKRLKTLLADRLRKENAELRKKLGLH